MTIALEMVEVEMISCDHCATKHPLEMLSEMITIPTTWGSFETELHFDSKKCQDAAEAAYDSIIALALERQMEAPAVREKARNTTPRATRSRRATPRPRGQSKAQEKKDQNNQMWATLEAGGFRRHKGHLSKEEKAYLGL